jgi:hypothetical protein
VDGDVEREHDDAGVLRPLGDEPELADPAFSDRPVSASVRRLRTARGFSARLLGGAADAARAARVDDHGNVTTKEER